MRREGSTLSTPNCGILKLRISPSRQTFAGTRICLHLAQSAEWSCRTLHDMGGTFRVGDWPHGPLGGFVVAVLVIPAWPWELDAVQLDVAARGGLLPADVGAHPPLVGLVRVHESVDLVVVG